MTANGIVHKIVQPEGWPPPRGYANGISATGRMVFTGGLVGWDSGGRFPDDFVAQVRQTLSNTRTVLEAAGAKPEHMVRMTWYVRNMDAYLATLKEIGTAYVAVMGRNYPAMALVEVGRLVEPKALLEIETTAVVPE